jgi:hypothetical protein
MTTVFSDIGLQQLKPYTLPNAQVQVTFTLSGELPDIVQVWAQEPGSQTGILITAVLEKSINWPPPTNPKASVTFEVQAGSAFDIWLCPRDNDETTGGLDDDYDGSYWQNACTYAGEITTQVPAASSQHPTKPVIIKVDNEPATLTSYGTITVSWVSTQYDKFLITWTQDGFQMPQGEVDVTADSGSWTTPSSASGTNQPVNPGASCTFAVEGGTDTGLFSPPNYSGWGPTVNVTAVQNLRSLVQFLLHSGINWQGLSVKSIMGGQTSLKQVMKLT